MDHCLSAFARKMFNRNHNRNRNRNRNHNRNRNRNRIRQTEKYGLLYMDKEYLYLIQRMNVPLLFVMKSIMMGSRYH